MRISLYKLKVLTAVDLVLSAFIICFVWIKFIYIMKDYYCRAFSNVFMIAMVCSLVFSSLYAMMFMRLIKVKVNSLPSFLDSIWILLGIYTGTYVSLFIIFNGGFDFYKFKNGKWRSHGL